MKFHTAGTDIPKAVMGNGLIHKNLSQFSRNPIRKLKPMTLNPMS